MPPSPHDDPGALSVSPHAPLLHVATTQGPRLLAQGLPQPPQFSGLVEVSTHTSPMPLVGQQTSPVAQGRVGLFVPGMTGTQVPGELVVLQASQVELHAVEQQTPSVQKPLAHWLAVRHASPGVFESRQMPVASSQYFPAPQSASSVQGAHLPALQKPVVH
jgi:hypothetical protein